MSRNHYPAPEGKDPALWEIAQKRASFQSHALTYLAVNAFLWILWAMGDRQDHSDHYDQVPWPLWATIGWGIGLAFHFAGAYVFPRVNSVEREYEKLKNKS